MLSFLDIIPYVQWSLIEFHFSYYKVYETYNVCYSIDEMFIVWNVSVLLFYLWLATSALYVQVPSVGKDYMNQLNVDFRWFLVSIKWRAGWMVQIL